MSERYEPPSDFLKAVIAEDVPLVGSQFAEVNLCRLIDLTRDPDRRNRDWATLLLSQEGGDAPVVRAALLRAASDDDEVVSAEAVLGLAIRDPDAALPFVQEALRGASITMPMLEAAELCAHPSLIEDLRIWAEPSSNVLVDNRAAEALVACERASGQPL